MIPRYVDIEIPLLAELHRRGGRARPSSKDESGDTVYFALAKYFKLTKKDLAERFWEKGKPRPKWNTMVRFARKALKNRGLLDGSKHGIWDVTTEGGRYLDSVDGERLSQRLTQTSEQISAEELQRILEKARQIGLAGEQHVLTTERRRLTAKGRADLAAEVRHVAIEDVTAGYDVLSYETDGESRMIEVKSTVSDGMSFELTENELRTAKREKHRYFIYRVSRVNTDSPRIEIIDDPCARIREGKLHLRPTAYTVTVGENLA